MTEGFIRLLRSLRMTAIRNYALKMPGSQTPDWEPQIRCEAPASLPI
jgi:hypothetical protein